MASRQGFRARWRRLGSLTGISPQERGYELERLLFDLASSERIAAAPSYRGAGEQIDLLLNVDGRYVLVEAKWVAAPVPVSDVYAFRAKVEGKLVGTIGLYVSVSGFAVTVPDALRFGKEVNVLLADRQDLDFALDRAHGLAGVIRAKMRGAARYGEVFYRYQRHLDEQALRS